MIPNHKAMQRAMMIAQDIAQQIDPAYGRVNLPPTTGGIPEEYQQGGAIVDPNVLNELAKGAVSAINKSRAGLAYGGISDERDQIENAGSYFEAPAEERGLPDAGGVRGSESVLPTPVPTGSPEPLEGLPTQVKIPMTGEMIEAGPDERIRKVAEDYMRSIGREYKPASSYAKVEPERASRIAQAYHEMKHDPSDAFVRSAYDQMLKETMDQYQAAKEAGFKAEFWNPERDEDPYKASPRLAIKDINENHHMYVFPTRAGFGSDEEMASQLKDNPLLADSGERWNGEPVTYNDIFRAVHDYYGHAKEGVGFRADGEENAWRSHASMYSPLARLAMTSETRGQNSWLNYGPHGEHNRNARTEDTIFADQKIGLLPAFAIHEGAEDFMRPEDIAEVRQLYKRTKREKGGATINTPVLDKGKAIRRALRIAKQEGGPLSGGMQPRGLEFPPEDAAFRLRTKLNREAKVAAGKEDPGLPSNPRMTIRAPEAEEGGNQLPDFVVGPVTPQDWIDRHEKILSPDEITHASQWYKNIYGNFLQYTNNDEAQAKPLMRAWLVAQQNVSPAGAMQNVLLQKEQMQRGVPESMWRAGGMPNPTNAARAVLQDKPIAGGVGQKISDFVDSAEGLDTRSFLGHDQKGGKPFVIDVHSARDTGLVDPALLNHLRGLGYNEDDLAKVQTDFEASPSDAQYENRAQWGRDLTDHLNGIKWQGKSDWRPEEIQAVGWMGMTKLTRNAEEDSASGLSRNLRRVSFELAPGEGSPWAAKYGEAFSTLPDDERALITQTMGGRAMEIANELAQTHAVNTVYGTGAWQQYQNPAAVAQVLATEQGADILAHSIGHLLHQTEVWHNRAKPMTANPKGFAIDFIEQGSNNLADKGQLQDFWSKVMDADKTGLIQGYQPITLPSGESGVRVLVDKGGKKTSENLFKALSENGELGTMLKSLPYDVQAQLAEAEISKARNDWKENPNGELYIQGLRDILGSDPSARLGAAGSQLEKELEALLDQAYTRQGRAWRTAQGPEEGQVTAVKPKKTRAKVMADGGAVPGGPMGGNEQAAVLREAQSGKARFADFLRQNLTTPQGLGRLAAGAIGTSVGGPLAGYAASGVFNHYFPMGPTALESAEQKAYQAMNPFNMYGNEFSQAGAERQAELDQAGAMALGNRYQDYLNRMTNPFAGTGSGIVRDERLGDQSLNLPQPTAGMASGGIVDRALKVAAQARRH